MKSYEIRPEIPQEARNELIEHGDLLAHLLYHRGIKTKKEADQFLNLSYEKSIHDPFLMRGMQDGVNLIIDSINKNKKIVIYSDYDADGIPGAVVLSDFFKKINYENFFVYIPHRNKEGFGLNFDALEKIKDKGAELLITVDCGIADIDEVNFARELEIDVLITDHHEPNGKIPNANVIINHKQEDCNYPEQILCGSGVVFKLVQALVKSEKFDIPNGWEKTLLDMVGVATLSDMVPLVGENRALASFGLTILRMSPRKGLHKLFKATRTNQKEIDEDTVGFTISPRINAASRMGEPEAAFLMLSTNDEIEAGSLVSHLHEINDQRKGHVASMVKEIKKDLKEKENIPDVIVHGNPNWKPSLLGLAANSICEEYKRPVFLWGRGEGKELKGSCRTYNGFSLIDIMNNSEGESLFSFGGHNEAGGFVVVKEKVDFLEEDLNKSFQKIKNSKSLDKSWVDKSLRIEDVNHKLFSEIEKLSPFGVGNEKPIFIFKNVILKSVDLFGKTKEHIKLSFQNTNINAIAFFKRKDSFERDLKEGDLVNIVAHIEKDFFGGNKKLRLKIIDII